MSSIKINHVAIVAEDLDTALQFWRDKLGLPVKHIEHNDAEAVDVAFLGDGTIELIAPTTADTGITKYIKNKGAGMHHLCLEVEDIASTMQELKAKNVELINDAPRSRAEGIKYAFIHPKSTGGVLIELYELPPEEKHHG